jgi:hypothetical protein
VKRAERTSPHDSGFGSLSASPRCSSIHVHKRIEFGIQPFDLRQVSLNEFDCRDFLFADALGHHDGGKKEYFVH